MKNATDRSAAAKRAAATRKANAAAKKRREAAVRAAATRKANASAKKRSEAAKMASATRKRKAAAKPAGTTPENATQVSELPGSIRRVGLLDHGLGPFDGRSPDFARHPSTGRSCRGRAPVLPPLWQDDRGPSWFLGAAVRRRNGALSPARTRRKCRGSPMLKPVIDRLSSDPDRATVVKTVAVAPSRFNRAQQPNL